MVCINDIIALNRTFLSCLTFTVREGVIPVAGGAVLAGENGMPTELIARETLEGNGLAHIEAGAHHRSIAERLRIRALLEFISCNKHQNVMGQEKKTGEKYNA